MGPKGHRGSQRRLLLQGPQAPLWGGDHALQPLLRVALGSEIVAPRVLIPGHSLVPPHRFLFAKFYQDFLIVLSKTADLLQDPLQVEATSCIKIT